MRRFTGATHAFVCVKLKPSLRASERLCRLVHLEELLLGLELLRHVHALDHGGGEAVAHEVEMLLRFRGHARLCSSVMRLPLAHLESEAGAQQRENRRGSTRTMNTRLLENGTIDFVARGMNTRTGWILATLQAG
jgi:hypothetical protein